MTERSSSYDDYGTWQLEWRDIEYDGTGPSLQVGLQYEGASGFRFGSRVGWQGWVTGRDSCDDGAVCGLAVEVVRVGYGF